MAYNATKLSKIVQERDKAENWLDYFQIKYQRNPAMRPMTKVPPCNHVIFSLVAVHQWRILCSFFMSYEFVSHEMESSFNVLVAFLSKEVFIVGIFPFC